MVFPFNIDPGALFQEAKCEGEEFVKQKKYFEALCCYNTALEIRVNLGVSKEEVAKIYSNRSLVFLKLGAAEQALSDAQQCIGLLPNWWKGYWRATEAHKLANETVDCSMCLSALWNTPGPSFQEDDQICVLVEMAITIPKLSSIGDSASKQPYSSLELPTNTTLWSKVLKRLAAGHNWEAVCVLILGLSGCADIPFECVAADSPTNDINVGELLRSVSEVDLKTWAIKLAICLLKKGAAVSTVAPTPDEPVPISALITALQTGVHDLFKYIMENIPSARVQIDNKNLLGETALHVIVKSGETNSFNCEALLKLLLSYGCATNIRDRHGKLPIDCVDVRSPVYGILMSETKRSEEILQNKISSLHEKGNKAQKENQNEQALEHYEAAIALATGVSSMNTDLAILHSNCSLVYSNMADPKRALTAAHYALMADSTCFKGYWRLGQVYKSVGHFSESYDMFLSGLTKAIHPDDESKTSFLLEIAQLLPPLENTGSTFLDKLPEIAEHFRECWPKVLETLSKSGHWSSVKILIMGVNYKHRSVSKVGMIVKNVDFKPNARGIAANFPASSAVLSSIVDAPETAAWADELMMVLLAQKASLETLTVSTNTPSLHIVTKLCIVGGNVALLSQVLSTHPQLATQKQIQDDRGSSLFHVICHCFNSGESPIAMKLIDILLEQQFDPTVQDNRGMKPVDLVPFTSSLHKLLTNARYGKTTEAAQLMLKNGKLKEALAAAEKGRDFTLIGECHFIVSKTEEFENAVHHLNKAVESFQMASDNTGLGKALVALARIKVDKDMAKRAFILFRDQMPFSNDAGVLEALQVIVELSSLEKEFEDCLATIRGIQKTFHVIEKLFKQSTPEDKARAQMYYRFYGMYQNRAKPSHFDIHLKEHPQCIDVIDDLFEDKKERKQAVIEREKTHICVSLCRFLIGRMKEWFSMVESAFQQRIQEKMQCKAYLDGSECEDELCPYMHKMYSRTAAFSVLKLFVWDVSLSYIVQNGVDMVKRLKIPELSEEVGYLIEEGTKFDSCERLLDFLMPLNHHLRFLSENVAVVEELRHLLGNSDMCGQVKKYLENLWMNPSGKEKKDICKERCRSTDWVLRIAFFSSLLNLNLDVTKYCQHLEKQLMTDAPEWLAKRSRSGQIPYALLVDYHKNKLLVECLANRFIQASTWLQGKAADPMESIMKFTTFVKILSLRDRPGLLPAKAMMLFWLEIYVSLSLFLLGKLTATGTHFILPATYLAAVNFVNLSFTKQSLPIQELIHLYKHHHDKVELLKDRVQIMVGLVCGYRSRMSLLRLLFIQNKGDFVPAERCLVLTLVLLVNIGSLLPIIYESHIMQAITRLHLPDSAPQRLHKTLTAVDRAKGLVDIVAILRDLLHEREDEHLLDCVWSWDRTSRQGVQFQQLTDFSKLPKGFLSYNASGNETVEDEDEMTAEHRERFRREHQQRDIDEKKNKASKIIQRFFKKVTMKYRIEDLAKRALQQEMLEVFAPFAIKDTFCGVCGVSLSNPLTEESVSSSTDQNEPNAWNIPDPSQSSNTEELTSTRSLETLQTHRLSKHHSEKNTQFERFQKLYNKDRMRELLHELSFFIGFHKLRRHEMKEKCYSDVSLDIERLLSEMDQVKTILQKIMETRSWEKIKQLRHALFILYQDYLYGRGVISGKFQKYQESLN